MKKFKEKLQKEIRSEEILRRHLAGDTLTDDEIAELKDSGESWLKAYIYLTNNPKYITEDSSCIINRLNLLIKGYVISYGSAYENIAFEIKRI